MVQIQRPPVGASVRQRFSTGWPHTLCTANKTRPHPSGALPAPIVQTYYVLVPTSARRQSHEDPLGKRLTLGTRSFEIVGVVRHVEHIRLYGKAPVQPQFYLNFNQTSLRAVPSLVGHINLLVRSASDPLNLAGAVRSQVWALNKDQPVFNVRTMDQIVSQSIAPRRFSALL